MSLNGKQKWQHERRSNGAQNYGKNTEKHNLFWDPLSKLTWKASKPKLFMYDVNYINNNCVHNMFYQYWKKKHLLFASCGAGLYRTFSQPPAGGARPRLDSILRWNSSRPFETSETLKKQNVEICTKCLHFRSEAYLFKSLTLSWVSAKQLRMIAGVAETKELQSHDYETIQAWFKAPSDINQGKSPITAIAYSCFDSPTVQSLILTSHPLLWANANTTLHQLLTTCDQGCWIMYFQPRTVQTHWHTLTNYIYIYICHTD